MADKLQGTWVFDKVTTASPVSPPTSKYFGVNFISNGVEFQKLSIRNAEDVTTSKTYRLTYEWDTPVDGSYGVTAFDYGAWNEAYKTIEITSKYDEVEDAETLVKALSARASFIPAWGDIEIVMTSANGVLLKTLDKFCKNDILVTPDLEELTVTENGEYTPSKVGYSKVTVNVEASGGEADKYKQIFERTATEFSDATITKISDYVFYHYDPLVNIDVPNVTHIGKYALYGCNGLANINAPNITDIGDYCLYGCTGLRDVSFPKLKNVGGYAFNNVYYITSLDVPALESCGNDAFKACGQIVSISVPNLITAGNSAFESLSYMVSFDAPKLETLPQRMLMGAKVLKSVNVPNATTVRQEAFQNCLVLESLDLPKVTSLNYSYIFNNCYKFTTLILRSVTLCTLSSLAFTGNNPFYKSNSKGELGGKLIVPRALVEEYKTATNWSVIWGYGHNQFLALEDYTVDGTITGEIDWDKLNGGTTA